MENNRCLLYCKDQGYKYTRTENGDECYCGDDPYLYGPENLEDKFIMNYDCNKECIGNSKQICGGGWRLSVYETANDNILAKPIFAVETTFLRRLSASSFNLNDFNKNEFKFWEGLVLTVVGSSVPKGLSNEDRKLGLKLFRKKALIFFLSANLPCVVALVGFYAFSMYTLSCLCSKSTFSIVMGVMLVLPPPYSNIS
ncbi:unnamed protein product [Mytilus coruscus]|uniref:WSC domain-containing protein n=1 Tax=Mytilus coruscus TaxID=42192 RepID=A0A6J8EJY4_MYTCO|nr:unnamed protein product [Mytilus coruscus]